MNQRSIIGLLVLTVAMFGGLIYYDINYGHKFDKLIGKEKKPVQNWMWEDNWDSKSPSIAPDKATPKPDPVVPGAQLVATSYADALQKSGELGKPVLVFFAAEWCTWCKKMKAETMIDNNVQTVLKNYVLVYVDTDKDRSSVKKFGVESLPSYVITNSKEEKLKMDGGFKGADAFASWLNNPSMYVQPKAEKKQETAPPKSKPKSERKRPLFRRSNPPQPQNPDMAPKG